MLQCRRKVPQLKFKPPSLPPLEIKKSKMTHIIATLHLTKIIKQWSYTLRSECGFGRDLFRSFELSSRHKVFFSDHGSYLSLDSSVLSNSKLAGSLYFPVEVVVWIKTRRHRLMTTTSLIGILSKFWFSFGVRFDLFIAVFFILAARGIGLFLFEIACVIQGRLSAISYNLLN